MIYNVYITEKTMDRLFPEEPNSLVITDFFPRFRVCVCVYNEDLISIFPEIVIKICQFTCVAPFFFRPIDRSALDAVCLFLFLELVQTKRTLTRSFHALFSFSLFQFFVTVLFCFLFFSRLCFSLTLAYFLQFGFE